MIFLCVDPLVGDESSKKFEQLIYDVVFTIFTLAFYILLVQTYTPFHLLQIGVENKIYIDVCIRWLCFICVSINVWCAPFESC